MPQARETARSSRCRIQRLEQLGHLVSELLVDEHGVYFAGVETVAELGRRKLVVDWDGNRTLQDASAVVSISKPPPWTIARRLSEWNPRAETGERCYRSAPLARHRSCLVGSGVAIAGASGAMSAQ
jgi:hypothetical protein